MDPFSPARRCVTILLPCGMALTSGGLRLLLRYAQRRAGTSPWGAAAADEFLAAHGTLVIARPALSAAVAPYALPFIHKYFTL